GRATETKAMMAFLHEHRFTMSANIHAGTEVVNYPWDDRDSLHADDAWFRFVSREYADEVHAVDPDYMNLWEDGITNGADWLKIYGGRQDYVTYYLEGREVTLELSIAKLLGSAYLDEFWQKNERSLLNYMAQCMYGIRGQVTDLSTGEAVMARIEIPGHDSTWSVVHSRASHGDFYRLLAEGVYELVVSATGYIPETIPNVEVWTHTATTLDISLVPGETNRNQPDPVVPSVRIYPNPVSERLYIESRHLSAGTFDVAVISMDGRIQLRRSLHHEDGPVPLSTGFLDNGFYVLRIISGEGTYILRFMKE
ncbi:MAG: T9SS type A sorting domain-containing protein, partial [Bacteroidales bacterium]|nr:T9SS type A sorting domain-containing protein [Bacteroidales bacterium]